MVDVLSCIMWVTRSFPTSSFLVCFSLQSQCSSFELLNEISIRQFSWKPFSAVLCFSGKSEANYRRICFGHITAFTFTAAEVSRIIGPQSAQSQRFLELSSSFELIPLLINFFLPRNGLFFSSNSSRVHCIIYCLGWLLRNRSTVSIIIGCVRNSQELSVRLCFL